MTIEMLLSQVTIAAIAVILANSRVNRRFKAWVVNQVIKKTEIPNPEKMINEYTVIFRFIIKLLLITSHPINSI